MAEHNSDLKKYQEKRDFSKTPEPAPKVKNNGNIFVIQKHAARRLHYDLRLSVDGVLKSWAVPNEPTLVPADKKLAVHTEDHPMDYANFEGTIPKGEYGAGKVEIWDKGTYRNMRKKTMAEAISEGKVEFYLKGQRLNGAFALINTKFNDDPKNWLLIKMREDKFRFENG